MSQDEDNIDEFPEEYGEEYIEEFITEETISAPKSTIPSVVEEVPITVSRHFTESSSSLLSTVVSPFDSSSALGSTYPPASWPSSESKSDVYLQSSGKFVDGQLYPEFPSLISLVEKKSPIKNKPVKLTKHPVKSRPQPSLKSDLIIEPEVKIKKSKCKDIVFLRDLIDDVLDQIENLSVEYNDKLKISIDKNKALSETIFTEITELCLPENDFAGEFTISISDMHDGAFIETSSCFKENNLSMSTRMFSKITSQFMVVEEKRSEFQFDEVSSREKSLHVFFDNDNFIAYREFRDNDHTETYRGCISLACATDFILDGNLSALMKTLISINFSGSFQCYTVNISGKVCRCVFFVDEKVTMPINGQPIEVIPLRKSTYKYGTRNKIEITQSYYLPSGSLVYHSWRHSPYIIHIDPVLLRNQDKLNPCMELNWKSDCVLYSMLQFEKEHTKCVLQNYLDKYPEVIELLNDYIISLFHKKPQSVISFTCDFFENF